MSPKREAVMSEAELFRHYAREAARSSSQATSENEKQVLMGLACTWAQAALMSERVLGSSLFRRHATLTMVPRSPGLSRQRTLPCLL
jgi:hypothetical protein